MLVHRPILVAAELLLGVVQAVVVIFVCVMNVIKGTAI